MIQSRRSSSILGAKASPMQPYSLRIALTYFLKVAQMPDLIDRFARPRTSSTLIDIPLVRFIRARGFFNDRTIYSLFDKVYKMSGAECQRFLRAYKSAKVYKMANSKVLVVIFSTWNKSLLRFHIFNRIHRWSMSFHSKLLVVWYIVVVIGFWELFRRLSVTFYNSYYSS